MLSDSVPKRFAGSNGRVRFSTGKPLSDQALLQLSHRADAPVGPMEVVEPYRRRIHADVGHLLRDKLVGWTATIGNKAVSEMPAGIEDGAADA